ncbi:uncharacterized protein LOC116290774 isoform X1 [Actinia tenebrosa]|uniref:Uncharacterized protein LOC116290774 isoform X1 n=1 Tax=Actinia tenebrosa TaxID=6105 RepID=A0A6P8HFF5_ACTTE|nr:uncharacterized protein LOC116290774 isoform X1 [Actinia tenebrosa]
MDSVWDSLDHEFLQKDIRRIFQENKIDNIEAFLKLDSEDLKILGVRFHSDKCKLLDKQKELLLKEREAGHGGGLRTDLRGLEDDWKKIEDWRRNKAPFAKKSHSLKLKQRVIAFNHFYNDW